MQSLVSLLEQTWARLVSFLDVPSLAPVLAVLRPALSDALVRQSIGVGLAVFVAVLLIGRVLRRRDRRSETEILRERLREVELKLEGARGEVATAKRVQNDLQKGDPQVFAAALATAIAEGGPKAQGLDPEAWLSPLRPALADAYLHMARAVLGKVKGADDLTLARRMAQGAVAADPERKECAELLARIDEAERMGLFSEMSEADALAWRIARHEAGALAEQRARGLVARSRGQIGYSILLSGWEAEELHASALAALADQDLADAFGAETGRETAESGKAEVRTGRRAGATAKGATAGATIEGARVVPLSSGTAARDADMIEDAEEIRAVGAGGRGNTVLVMPRGRMGGRGDALDTLAVGSGRGGRDTGSETGGPGAGDSDREAEFRRLWERRRRPDMLGETHPRTLAARANMGYEACRKGRHAEAEAIFREVIEGMESAEAPGDHRSEALTVRHNLAVSLLRQGKLAEAEAEFRDILAELGAPSEPGQGGPLAMAAAHGLAEVWSARGDHAEAEAGFAAVWKARSADAEFGQDHPHTLWSRVRMLHQSAVAGRAAAS